MKNKILGAALTGSMVLMLAGCAASGHERIEIPGDYVPSATASTEFRDPIAVQAPAAEPPAAEPEDAGEWLEREARSYIASMPLEDKVAQLFIVLPEALVEGVSNVTAAGEMTKEAINRTPICGLVYMGNNLESEEQVRAMLANVQDYSLERTGLPAFLCIDEEGGTVTRIGGRSGFNVPAITDMAVIGERQDTEEAFEIGVQMGGYLSRLGFNVDFAPVADVLSNPGNQIVKRRSFGPDPDIVAAMASAVSSGLQSKGVLSTYKHFPGHGATVGDTHEGYAYTEKTLDELEKCELVPFMDGIDKNVPFIMVGHISVPKTIGDNTPSSLSPAMVSGLLRGELGYDGIIITDAFNMGAITQEYSPADAAVKGLEAGADIILMPEDFKEAYAGVLKAVEDGTLSRERIDESLVRIIRQKLKLKAESTKGKGE